MKIQAAMRLQSQALDEQLIDDSTGKLKIKQLAPNLKYSSAKHMGTVDGLDLYQIPDGIDRALVLRDVKKVIGYFVLRPVKFMHGYTNFPAACMVAYELFLLKPYRGRKLASSLFEEAMKITKHLVSDTAIALGAAKAFMSLAKHGHKIKLIDMITNKQVPYTIGADGLPEVDGKSMQSYTQDFVFYI